jgi:hypothetical protein
MKKKDFRVMSTIVCCGPRCSKLIKANVAERKSSNNILCYECHRKFEANRGHNITPHTPGVIRREKLRQP